MSVGGLMMLPWLFACGTPEAEIWVEFSDNVASLYEVADEIGTYEVNETETFVGGATLEVPGPARREFAVWVGGSRIIETVEESINFAPAVGSFEELELGRYAVRGPTSLELTFDGHVNCGSYYAGGDEDGNPLGYFDGGVAQISAGIDVTDPDTGTLIASFRSTPPVEFTCEGDHMEW